MLEFRDQIRRDLDNYDIRKIMSPHLDITLRYDESKLDIAGVIPNSNLGGCSNSQWSITYNTNLTYNGSIAVMGLYVDDNYLYLDMSNMTRVVIGSSGVIGVEYPDKSEFSRYFDEALNVLGTKLDKILSGILDSVMSLRVKFSTVYDTVNQLKDTNSEPGGDNSVWVSKGNIRIKVAKDNLKSFLSEGFIVSPKKETSKTTKKTTKKK